MKRYLCSAGLTSFAMTLFNTPAYARVRIHSVNGGDGKSLLVILIICAIASFGLGIYGIYKENELPSWVVSIFLSSVISIILNLLLGVRL